MSCEFKEAARGLDENDFESDMRMSNFLEFAMMVRNGSCPSQADGGPVFSVIDSRESDDPANFYLRAEA